MTLHPPFLQFRTFSCYRVFSPVLARVMNLLKLRNVLLIPGTFEVQKPLCIVHIVDENSEAFAFAIMSAQIKRLCLVVVLVTETLCQTEWTVSQSGLTQTALRRMA